VSDKAQRKIRIKWVRSGIGFSYRAKEMIRSLGLLRLRQVVERPDTPQVRGLVARIPHLVEIVKEVPVSIWGSTPEYTITPPEAKPQPVRGEAGVAEAEKVSAVARSARKSKQEKREKERPAASKAAASKKQVKLAAKEKARATRAAESKKKERPAREKPAKPSGKGKK
jgi:large subunit ribosomal protein L30